MNDLAYLFKAVWLWSWPHSLSWKCHGAGAGLPLPSLELSEDIRAWELPGKRPQVGVLDESEGFRALEQPEKSPQATLEPSCHTLCYARAAWVGRKSSTTPMLHPWRTVRHAWAIIERLVSQVSYRDFGAGISSLMLGFTEAREAKKQAGAQEARPNRAHRITLVTWVNQHSWHAQSWV